MQSHLMLFTCDRSSSRGAAITEFLDGLHALQVILLLVDVAYGLHG